MVRAIVVADTSVLINFLRIDRMDLIGAHPASFIATDHVAAEIADTYPDQQARYAAAVAAGHSKQRIDDPDELEMFLRLAKRGRLGPVSVPQSRSPSIANARSQSTIFAAIHHALEEAAIAGNVLTILRTQDIMVELIRVTAVSIEAADAILVDWAANHRFRLKITSFRDVL